MTPEQLLDQLRAQAAPPPPDNLERGVHQRVNRALTLQQMLDFALGAAPMALVELTRATADAARFTLTGKRPATPRNAPQK